MSTTPLLTTPWEECAPLTGSRVLITGGAGFIGSNLAATLSRHGVNVRVLDNLSTGYRENLRTVRPAVELVEGDIRDTELCRTVMQGVDAVAHLAAEVSVPRSVEQPRNAHDINITGSLNILLAARDAGVKAVALASSCALYGDGPESPKHEGLLPLPQSPYAAHKLAMETYAGVFSRLYGLKAVSLRFFNVFGPQQDPRGAYAAVAPLFAARMLAGVAPTIHGDGLQSRDFIFVADVVQGLIRAMTAPESAAGDVFNIGSGEERSVMDLYRTMSELLHFSLPPQFSPARPGDVRNSRADASKAARILGFAPRFTFAQGLETALHWYRTHLDASGSRTDLA